MALLENLEREQKLLAELVLALAEIALRRQHADRVVGIGCAAEIGLATVDGEHDGRIDAELLLDLGERRAVLLKQLAALPGKLRDRRLFDVLCRRLHEFRLSGRRPFRPAGQNEIGQRQVGLEAARRQIERRARHAERLGLRPQRLQPRLEGRIGERGLHANRVAQQHGTNQGPNNFHRTARMNRRGNFNNTRPSNRGL